MPDLNVPPQSKEAIGLRLRVTREAMEIGQTDFARRVGISKTRLEGYEVGRNLMKPEVAVLVINEFRDAKLDFNWFYHGDLSSVAHALAVKIEFLLNKRAVA